MRRTGLDSAALGFLEGLKGYDPLVRATQFQVVIDLVTKEPIDAGSVEQALLRALATEAFGIGGMAVVTARAVLPPPNQDAVTANQPAVPQEYAR